LADDNSQQAETPEDTPNYESAAYWFRWLSHSKREAKPHFQDGRSAWKEYENGRKQVEDEDKTKGLTPKYPIYWSSCKTLEPAFYSRTPKIQTRRKFEVNDGPANTACLIGQRFAEWLIENSNFDAVMRKSVQDFIHADKACTQVVVEEEVENVPARIPLTQSDAQTFLGPDGKPYAGEVMQDEQGFFYTGTERRKKKVVKLIPAIFDEVLHTPEARTEAEIEDKAFHFSMTKEKALMRFPTLKGKDIAWKKGKEEEGSKESCAQFLEGYEIWCKATKKLYFVSEQYREGLLDSKDDPYRLRGFFPSTKFIISNLPSKSMYPTPAYIHLAPTCDQLHSMYERVFRLVHSIRRRALVDGAEPELINALNSDDLEFIAASLSSILEKGGLEKMVLFVPVAELVTALAELRELDNQFKNNFYEWMGVPDILRGVTDPIETLGAQEIKTGAAHDRFKNTKKMVAEMARDSIEMLLDLAVVTYTPEEIQKIVGFQFMSQEHQQNFMAGLEILKDDEMRLVRIEIDTDSLSFIDENQKQQKRQVLADTLTKGIQAVSQTSKVDPAFANVMLQVVLLTLEADQIGRDLGDGMKAAVGQLQEMAKQPPPPPPPDYEGMKIQVKNHELELKNVTEQRKLDLAQQKLALDEREQLLKTVLDAQKTELEERMQSFFETTERIRVALEVQATTLQAQETVMEEKRLALETMLKTVEEKTKTVTEATTSAQSKSPAPPPVTISLNTNQPISLKRPRRSKFKINRQGGEMHVESEDVDDEPTMPPAL
jgi:hypothetical protein